MACIIGLVLWFLAFLLNGQLEMVDIFNKVLADNFQAISVAEGLKHNFIIYDDSVFRYLVTDDKTILNESQRTKQKISEKIMQMRKMVNSNTEKQLLIELDKEIKIYYSQVQDLIKDFKSVGQKKKILGLLLRADEKAVGKEIPKLEQEHTVALLTAEGRARLTKIYTMCEKLVDINRSRLEDAEENVGMILSQSQDSAFRSGSVIILIIIFIALILIVSIVSPLSKLLAGVKKVTEGNLDLEIQVKSGDEVGKLTNSFNTMTRKLKEEHNKLLTQTITDQLTGVHNFRFFQEFLNNELGRAVRYESPITLLIADIDYFKHYNDTNGHQMGNVVLKDVAMIMKESLRREDFIARYGGEEFVIVLPETPENGGKKVAERIRQSVEQYEFPLGEKQPNKRLTVSIGGTSFSPKGDFSKGIIGKQLIEEADKALYEAKQKNRNRVEWFTEAKQ
ncbi:MAG: diguanylate cyclase [bacterium]